MKKSRKTKDLIYIFSFIVLIIFSFSCKEKKYTITFMSDDTVFKTIEVTKNEYLELDFSPEKEGYTFDGWYIDEDTYKIEFTNEYINDNKLESNLKVYAKFTKINEVNINIIPTIDNIAVIESPKSSKVNSFITINIHDMLLGYKFDGLYIGDLLLSNQKYFLYNIGENDVTITAKFSIDENMKNFLFSSTITSCVINSVIDKSINDLTIPDYVTEIADNAFKDCINLKEIYVPKSVITIGEGAFSGCTSLEKITIPFLGKKASFDESDLIYPFGYIFGTEYNENCIQTKQAYFHSKNIDKSPVNFEYSNKYYYIPKTLTTVTALGGRINFNAFKNCESITDVTLGENITYLGEEAFSNCKNLINVIIKQGLRKISTSAFSNCVKLKHISIPNSINKLGYNVFSRCSSLEEITIPDSVNDIGDGLFGNCKMLKHIYLSVNIKEINRQMFLNCTSLETFTIPNHIVKINDNAFEGCINLKEIILLNGIEKIGNSVFYKCQNLSSINIPDSVTELGDKVFANCFNLKNVKLSENIKSLNYNTFFYCTSLTDITLPKNLISIDNEVFVYNNISNIIIPTTLTFIGEKAFYGNSSKLIIFYEGNKVKSNDIYITPNNEDLSNADWYYYSEINIDDSLNYWCYDESGKIKLWNK